jgi:hypothetical protein
MSQRSVRRGSLRFWTNRVVTLETYPLSLALLSPVLRRYGASLSRPLRLLAPAFVRNAVHTSINADCNLRRHGKPLPAHQLFLRQGVSGAT